MSVIIKGFDTDGNCLHCFFQSEDTDRCLLTDDDIPLYGKGRPESCPLVPLPEGHGDLIDKQAFIADIAGFIKCMSNVGALVDGETLYGKLLDALANAKTVVPAEGGTGDGQTDVQR